MIFNEEKEIDRMYVLWYCPNIGYTFIYVCRWSFLKSVKMSKFSLNHYQIVSNS